MLLGKTTSGMYVSVGLLYDDYASVLRVGKLNLVDLAGSERQSKTNAEGQRFQEVSHSDDVFNVAHVHTC